MVDRTKKTVVPKQPEAPQPPATTSTNAPAIEDEEEGLTPADMQFLGQAQYLLVSLQKPGLVKIAMSNGYTREEHAEGWRLHHAASGQERALTLVFGLSSATPSVGESYMPMLQSIDAFENLWFPRTRAIIQRVVPAANRDRFEAAFFHELAQQRLGPAVVGSVRTYIARVEGLDKSNEPGAREVRETLRKRGLSDSVVARMKSKLDSVTALTPEASETAVDEAALAKARGDQKRAVSALRRWYNDWSTTLRTVFNRKQLIQLGLVTPTRQKAGAPADPPAEAPPVA